MNTIEVKRDDSRHLQWEDHRRQQSDLVWTVQTMTCKS